MDQQGKFEIESIALEMWTYLFMGKMLELLQILS